MAWVVLGHTFERPLYIEYILQNKAMIYDVSTFVSKRNSYNLTTFCWSKDMEGSDWIHVRVDAQWIPLSRLILFHEWPISGLRHISTAPEKGLQLAHVLHSSVHKVHHYY